MEKLTNALQIKEFIEKEVKALGGTVFVPEKSNFMKSFKLDNHMFACMLMSKSKITLKCRKKVVEEISTADNYVNHNFGANYIFTELTEEAEKKIKNLLKASYDYQKEKNENMKGK